jgi:hypothetical protein
MGWFGTGVYDLGGVGELVSLGEMLFCGRLVKETTQMLMEEMLSGATGTLG